MGKSHELNVGGELGKAQKNGMIPFIKRLKIHCLRMGKQGNDKHKIQKGCHLAHMRILKD